MNAERVLIIDPLDGTNEYGGPVAPTGRCTSRCGSAAS